MSIFEPSNNSFRKQNPEEKTILVTRKHRIILFSKISFLGFCVLLPFIIYSLINSFSWYSSASSVYWFLVSIWFLLLWNLAFYSIMLYFLNTVIITNQRVIENKQNGFFDYRANEMELSKIQDISIKISGSLATFLDFGDIEIQSAGAKAKFYFDTVPHPEKIREMINEARKNI
jgi:hypothetical protein